jgi:hypothetical protein
MADWGEDGATEPSSAKAGRDTVRDWGVKRCPEVAWWRGGRKSRRVYRAPGRYFTWEGDLLQPE